MTGSAEIMREVYPTFFGAVFIDAGDASRQVSDWSAKFGYGVGVRWRSPVGPLRADVAYGDEEHRWRLHFSVGIAF